MMVQRLLRQAEQQAARAARREARVDEGLAILETFLADLAKQGLAGVERQPRGARIGQAGVVDERCRALSGAFVG